uniref:Cytochrome p450 3045A1 n=1 Tax=Brachionus koreanus TaxID=1199090 RepID=W8RYT2_9BILA|nr:cytochrome p450 3045A1 [Brachionus koreanus]
MTDWTFDVDKMLWLIFSKEVIILFVFSYLMIIVWKYQYFKQRGIKTPKYRFVCGNYFDLIRNNSESENVYKWTMQLGKTFGYFEGHSPVLVTSDLDIIQEVFIRQFSNFSARKKNPMEGADSREFNHLMRSSNCRWKRMRSVMNPTFSKQKLEKMNPLLNECIDRLIFKIRNNIISELKIPEAFKKLTMDSLWKCTYGIDLNIQNKPCNEYFKASEKIFADAYKFKFIKLLSIFFPEFDFLWIFFTNFQNEIKKRIGLPREPKVFIINEFHKTLKEKISNDQEYRKDYMQLLIDSLDDDEKLIKKYDHLNISEIKDFHLEKKLTLNEIKANLKMFMLAGYESTSFALSFCFHMLAIKKNEQETLYNEIEDFFSNESIVPDIQNVNRLPYLDMFCKEILRFYPISRVARRCVKQTTVKGINMTPGLIVRIHHFAIHFDPVLWGPIDPKEFFPLRHKVARNPLCFLAFGLGPRICLGMKFALSQMKLALVKCLLKFEIESTNETPKFLEFSEGILRTAINEFQIRFNPRTDKS